MHNAYLALGSNLGDRQQALDDALEALRAQPHVFLRACSSYYETDPVDSPPESGAFLNAAAWIQTSLTPTELLECLLRIEHEHGRVRSVLNAPRPLDLDILIVDDLIIQNPILTLPHPRMHQRRFVLEPLAEIAPQLRHPEIGLSIAELLAELPDSDRLRTVERIQTQWRPRLPMRDLVGKRAVITGSSSGIGRAIALELAAAGATVVIHGRTAATAERVATEVRSIGGDARIAIADLRTLDGCDTLLESVESQLAGADLWINNAGADTLTGEAASWSFDRKLDELWRVDVQATIRLSRAIGQRMVRQGHGVILTMGWDQAEMGMEGDSGQLFATIKSAIMAFTRSLAVELAPAVRVNALAPGWIRTAWGDGASPVWQERVRRETPLLVWGLPEDIAATAHWACSPAARFITGQILRINGGAVRG
ncbi:2-amino-4-hydroxy-6-hydroxymethyldihydropteridine diphosphokinase [Tuwongella immobilis]|uniref:2-amino-4-hydroxy-6-hydroxymethyldihydropteridine pyrophosphokinase n=1 Tax=Tuwongella immobilis TaxID=692036 RepID=A0A6C2YQJ1_9BACT|nr:2-amino-4-hydroxy-6-hydroxymethyldihydropteridine diphosphokinase [Tuwongella immobilis]VIP03664.1 3-oxoacyl-acp reductase : Uncharacterized protein OS=Singulisphaera acidiphila (strain ATCC BAA-1392 / DSM 18658 / VKM B-2454 / MOB10) GN=Sinac_1242 PE=4 SV=1: HPPK: adh_short_C2 [Tuwongella immobilis]VTS04696.1 3-oxoacyl-acp reductase : Uncharacterized protein OS=Singulisphaera acidiphila (strain ATCC BAA-1392 / DSM 18658 / VKM B-2454 / MOB10) GN=Sinac_1242 PE=4 SV=1: HPPK: adh_short_C2 [Tuwonge